MTQSIGPQHKTNRVNTVPNFDRLMCLCKRTPYHLPLEKANHQNNFYSTNVELLNTSKQLVEFELGRVVNKFTELNVNTNYM